MKLKVRRDSDHPAGTEPPSESKQTLADGGHNPAREPLSVVLLLLVSLCAVVLLKPDGDPDVWARLAVGKLVVESGGVSTLDPFSYTPKKPEWIDHEWGAGVVFYEVAALGGQKGLLVLKALLLFGTLLFIYLRARRATGRPPSLLFHVFLTGALTLGFVASIRAQAFTFFLFSAWFYLLENARRGDWRFAWLIPFSGLFWANLHGGFLAGIGLIVLYAVGEFIRRGEAARFGGLAVVTALTSLVNPYGLSYWSYLFDATTMSRATIAEWRPMDLLGSESIFLGFKVLLALTVLALLMKALEKDLPDLPNLVALVVTAVLGLRVARHLTFFVIASGPFIWSWLASLWNRFFVKSGRRVPPLMEAMGYGLSRGLLLLFTVLTLTTSPFRIVLFAEFPVRAVDFIAQNELRGNLLVPFNFGSYAIWRLYPACKVSMDGRYETVYLDSTFDAVRGFFAGAPGWATFLDAYPHDIILSPRNERLEGGLAQRPDWVVAYEDEGHRVYVRAGQQREWRVPGPPPHDDPFTTANMPSFSQVSTIASPGTP